MTAEEYTQRVNQIEADFVKTFNVAQKKESLRYLNGRADNDFETECAALIKRLSREFQLDVKVRDRPKATLETHVKAGQSVKALCKHPLNTSRALQCKQKLSKLRQKLEILLLTAKPDASLSIYY